jgi:hypothetical protein
MVGVGWWVFCFCFCPSQFPVPTRSVGPINGGDWRNVPQSIFSYLVGPVSGLGWRLCAKNKRFFLMTRNGGGRTERQRRKQSAPTGSKWKCAKKGEEWEEDGLTGAHNHWLASDGRRLGNGSATRCASPTGKEWGRGGEAATCKDKLPTAAAIPGICIITCIQFFHPFPIFY